MIRRYLGHLTAVVFALVTAALVFYALRQPALPYAPRFFVGSPPGVCQWSLSILSFLVMLGVGWLLHRGKRLEIAFLAAFIPLGLLMMAVMPISAVPDEKAHLQAAMRLAMGQLGSHAFEIPADFLNGLERPAEVTLSIQQARDFFTRSFSQATVTVQAQEQVTIYPIASYLPQALMMRIALCFTRRAAVVFYSARVGSLLVAALLFYAAIRRAPAGKGILFAVACLPITLQEAASASCDGMTIAGVAWAVAWLLELLASSDAFGRRQKVVWLLLPLGMLVWKIMYIPMLLTAFLLPRERFAGVPNPRRSKAVWLALGSLVLLAGLGFWFLTSVRLSAGNEGLTVSSLQRLRETLWNPGPFLRIQWQTLQTNFRGWIDQVFSVFAYLNIELVPWVRKPMLPLLLVLSLLDPGMALLKERGIRTGRLRAVLLCEALLCWFIIAGALYIWWTPYGATLIEGIQGRYFIPFLPAVLLCLPDLPRFRARKYCLMLSLQLVCMLSLASIANILTVTW